MSNQSRSVKIYHAKIQRLNHSYHGVTGNVGKEVTKILSAQKVPFRAMVRLSKGAEAVAALTGAEVVIGDFNDAKSVADALEGIDRAFLLTNSSEQAETQQGMFVDVAVFS
jgi:uncharacterized protein YbjT (DUF2867 family)